MCTPGGSGYSVASKVAMSFKDGVTPTTGLDGVYLNNLKDSPRQMALTSALKMPTIGGVVLDPTKARAF